MACSSAGPAHRASLIQNNLIDNLNDQQDCIETNNASPTITGNTLQNCSRGIYVFLASSPTVNGNNLITSNQYGLQVTGNTTQNPQPVVTGNQIFGNSQYDYYAFNFQNATNLVLNATGNWWGTTDLAAISNKILDLTDSYTNPTNYPTVNFASLLDGRNGSPIAGNYCNRPAAAANTTLDGRYRATLRSARLRTGGCHSYHSARRNRQVSRCRKCGSSWKAR